jgi:hypothetical protein
MQSWAWWCTPVIPAFGRQRQEDGEFKTSLGYIARPCLKTKTKHHAEYKLCEVEFTGCQVI